MGLFDKMKQAAANVSGNQTVTFTFQALPESLAQMQALPEASLDTPFKTAALTVCALCAYGADKTIGQEMLNWLRGPRPLNGQDISFLNDRFRDGKTYLPALYCLQVAFYQSLLLFVAVHCPMTFGIIHDRTFKSMLLQYIFNCFFFMASPVVPALEPHLQNSLVI
jgi:hypothetical protein